MQEQPYKISVDAARRLLTFSFEPVFWDSDVAKQFMTDCLSAVAALNSTPGDMYVLVDLRDAVIQSQDVYAKAQALVNSSAAKRTALVAATPRARMQTKRLIVRDNVQMFAFVADAQAWLFASAETRVPEMRAAR